MIDIEICVDSVESAIAADRGGAQRVELCSALSESGITPSCGLIRCVRQRISIDLFVIIRPRGGNFIYSDLEFEVMREDIRTAQSLGVNGVVLGMLTPDNGVDLERTKLLVDLARPLPVTFHRAFDLCPEWDSALEAVILTGAARLLTSGGSPDALQGTHRIDLLHKVAGNRIRIMAGGGVRPGNVAEIVQRTGIRDIHTSLNNNPGCAAGPSLGQGQIDSVTPFVVREEQVHAFKAALN